jgi:beta-N-acetylglucosaminidase
MEKGFYGRPWTLEQRKDLFIKMQEWGLNSYLYAPKDDYKHRYNPLVIIPLGTISPLKP